MEVLFNKWLLGSSKDLMQIFSSKTNDHARASFILDRFMANKPQTFLPKVFGKNAPFSKELRELGNVQYKNHSFDVAVQLYTKSAAYAPENSNEYELALSNRSACTLMKKNPVASLHDINSLLYFTNIESSFREKINKRKTECEKQVAAMSLIDSCDSRIPVIHDQSLYFSSASKKVCLAENDQVGRHLVIREPTKTGEILMIEKPYAYVVTPEEFYSNCSYCLKYCECLIPCSNCTTSLFCSQKCMNEGLNLSHRIECMVLSRLATLNLGKLEYLALRILLVATNCGESLDAMSTKLNDEEASAATYDSLDFLRIYNLTGNTEKRPVKDLMQRAFTACYIVDTLSSFTNFFCHYPKSEIKAATILLRLLQNLPCNAHEITEFRNGSLFEVGCAAYATFSLLNHSCDPNVVRQSCGNNVVLRAIREIRADEELLDNYGYHYATHNLEQRQNGLQQYYFICQCLACQEDWALYSDLPSEEPVLKTSDPTIREEYSRLTLEFNEKLLLVLENKVNIEIMDFLCDYLTFLDKNVQRPWQDYNKCQEAIKHGFNYLPDYDRIRNIDTVV